VKSLLFLLRASFAGRARSLIGPDSNFTETPCPEAGFA
jgi:hypothetical protein